MGGAAGYLGGDSSKPGESPSAVMGMRSNRNRTLDDPDDDRDPRPDLVEHDEEAGEGFPAAAAESTARGSNWSSGCAHPGEAGPFALANETCRKSKTLSLNRDTGEQRQRLCTLMCRKGKDEVPAGVSKALN